MWIWDVAKGITIAVSRIRFSKDGKKFCCLDAENRVIVWDTASYQTIGVLIRLSSQAEDVALCGSKVVVSHEGASVCVWDVAAGSVEKEYMEKEYVTLHGTYFRTENRIVNVMTGEDITSKCSDGQKIYQVTFSWDDTRVLIETLVSWVLLDVDSGNIIAHMGEGWVAFFAVDGKHFVARN